MTSTTTGSLHGTVVVCLSPPNGGIVVAGDCKSHHTDKAFVTHADKLFDLGRGFVVGVAGIWLTDDGTIDMAREVKNAYLPGDTAQSFLQRFDKSFQPKLETFLMKRWKEVPVMFTKEYLTTPTEAAALLVCQVGEGHQRAVMFEYFPTLANSKVVIERKETTKGDTDRGYYLAIGDGARFVNARDARFQELANTNVVNAAKYMVEQAIARAPETCGPPIAVRFLV